MRSPDLVLILAVALSIVLVALMVRNRLRKRLRVEYEMLLYQNNFAISVNLEIFEEIGDYPSWLRQHTLEKEVDRIRAAWVESGGMVSQDDLGILLNINRELRRVFRQSASSYVRTFDQTYQPPGGWALYFKRKQDTLN